DLLDLVDAGIEGFMCRPFTDAELSARIAQALRARPRPAMAAPKAAPKAAPVVGEELVRQLQLFMDLVPLPMVVCSAEDGRLVQANHELIALFDLDPERLRTYTAAQFYADAGQREEIMTALRRFGEVSRIEVAYRRTDGPELFALVSARLVRLAGRPLIMSVFHDITARKREETELIRSEERFRQIADSLPAQVYQTDADGRTTFVNRTSLAFTGQPIDRMLALGWVDCIHPEDRERLLATGRTAIRTRQATDVEFRARDAQGQWRILLARSRPFWNTDQSFAGLIGISVDITDIKRTETRFQVITDAIQEVFWMADHAERKIHYVSPAYRRVWGRDPDRLLVDFDDWLNAIHPEDRPRVESSLRKTKESPAFDHSYRVVRADGTVRRVRDRGWPVHGIENGQSLMVGVAEDVTELHDAQENLRLAKEAAERASLAKSRFLAAASHDLRQPLNAMSLLIGVMRTRAGAPEFIEVANQIQQSLDAMIEMFNALLDVSKLDMGAVSVERAPIAVNTLVDRLSIDFAPMAHEKGLTFRALPSSVVLDSDPTLLEQILRNLVVNAVHYTRTGGILIGVRRRAGRARIDVCDTGPGIRADELENIFEEFAQLGNPARSREQGHGIGLAIVRRAADLLGHRLEVRSVPGKGSCFSIEVPYSQAHPPIRTPSPAAGPVSASERRTLLVVEDDPLVSSAVEMFARDMGFDVVVATCLRDVMAKVAHLEAPPDLILADYRLPGRGNGVQVIRALRVRFGVQIPACVVTGDLDPGILRRAEAIGVFCLRKPVRPDDLAGLLRAAGTTFPRAAAGG
ncbi:MAG TPA: PAS domain S-box protein, partial [Arenibaculum sp.]|nr:PAS domain S-box protein [Arenibaculum sp.]